MKFSKRQLKFIFLALASGFVAWLSLGGIAGCAHFDIPGFCKELLDAGEFDFKSVYTNQCDTLAARSEVICGQLFNISVAALLVCAASAYAFIGESIKQNVQDNWKDDNS